MSVQRDSRVDREDFDEAIRQAQDLVAHLADRKARWEAGQDFDVDYTRRMMGNLEFAHRNLRLLSGTW